MTDLSLAENPAAFPADAPLSVSSGGAMGGKIGTSVLLRYGTGQLGAQIFRDTPAVLLPLFMTTMLGVPAWLAGLVVLIPKLWLIACDPLVGAWSDRVRKVHGRTPFLAGGAVLTSLGFVALFTMTESSSPTLSAALTCFLFFLASTAFSMFSVPYLAIAAALSPDPHERTRIMIFRMIFATFGVLVGVGVAQPMIYWLGGGEHGWTVMAFTLGAVCLVTMLVTAIGLARVPMIEDNAEHGSLFSQLKVIAGNKPYLILVLTCLIQNIGQASGYTVIGFVFLYALEAVWIIPVFILVMSITGIAAQPLWFALSRRWGKEKTYVFASALWALVTVSWFWMRPASEVLVTLPGVGALGIQHLLVLLRGAIIGVTNAAFVMLALSMLTDTIDYQRRRMGSANEGVFAGLFSAVEKLSFALGPVIAGLVMSAFGFVSSKGGAVAQTPHAITGILLLYSLIPAALQVVSLVVFSRYRVAKD
ncbi:MFS transporter [Novosphingobium profundi]|uniref:MFS transporter n=1 Tax=Novosphingobium profundi TaxID=1774954 RepID=UPI001BDAC8B9|nr:MFS transporter [Novosphingobium profundi]MBT0671018.1 MFS transporter [Novosphingobium profundi]